MASRWTNRFGGGSGTGWTLRREGMSNFERASAQIELEDEEGDLAAVSRGVERLNRERNRDDWGGHGQEGAYSEWTTKSGAIGEKKGGGRFTSGTLQDRRGEPVVKSPERANSA